MHACVIPSRHAWGCSKSQSATVAAVRPSACPSRLAVTATATIPISHRSVTNHQRQGTGSGAQIGLPRRVSSTPRTSTGGRSAASWGRDASLGTKPVTSPS